MYFKQEQRQQIEVEFYRLEQRRQDELQQAGEMNQSPLTVMVPQPFPRRLII